MKDLCWSGKNYEEKGVEERIRYALITTPILHPSCAAGWVQMRLDCWSEVESGRGGGKMFGLCLPF